MTKVDSDTCSSCIRTLVCLRLKHSHTSIQLRCDGLILIGSYVRNAIANSGEWQERQRRDAKGQSSSRPRPSADLESKRLTHSCCVCLRM